MTRTITFTYNGKESTHDIGSPAIEEINPVIAHAVAQVEADKAVAKYEEAATLAGIDPDNEDLQRAMQYAYNISMQACDKARKLRQQSS